MFKLKTGIKTILDYSTIIWTFKVLNYGGGDYLKIIRKAICLNFELYKAFKLVIRKRLLND